MNRKTILVVAVMNIVTLLLVALMLHSNSVQAKPLLVGNLSPQAGAPGFMTYQGYLTDSAGEPLDSNEPLNMVFGIYTNEVRSSEDVPIWSEGPLAVEVNGGYFNVILGTSPDKTLDASHFAEPERWLQITLEEGASATYLPRQRLLSVPYAFQADYAVNADTLDGIDSTQFLSFTPHIREVFRAVSKSGNEAVDLTAYDVPVGVKAVLVQLSCGWPGDVGVCYIKYTDGGEITLNVNKDDIVDTALVPVQNNTLYLQFSSPTNASQTSLVILGYFK